MKNVEDLKAWQNAMQLIVEVHRLTKKFPKDELYGLTQQARKSSTSILLNLSEGFGRYTYADKANKYTIARGECSETHTCLKIAVALAYLAPHEIQQALNQIELQRKLLSGLIVACRDQEAKRHVR